MTQEGVLAIWQLVYEIRPVLKATAGEISSGYDAFNNPVDQFGYVAYSDPDFASGSTDGLLSSDLGAVDVEQKNDIVPNTTFFPTP